MTSLLKVVHTSPVFVSKPSQAVLHTIPRLIFQHTNFTAQMQSSHQFQIPNRAKATLSSASRPWHLADLPNLSATPGLLPNWMGYQSLIY